MVQSVPVMSPKLPEMKDVEPYLEQMYRNHVFTNRGPLLNHFEHRLSGLFRSKSANTVVCSNATIAIQGIATLIEQTEFRVPAFTFPATIHALSASKKNIYLEDISSSTWEINPTSCSKNEALVRVSAFGSVPKFDDANKWGHLLLDAAASIGCQEYDFSEIPENATIVFSLHATKVLGIGEGAVVVFGNEVLANDFRKWINFGFDGSRESEILGTNAKLSEISAAYGHAALDNWETEKVEWLSSRAGAIDISNHWKISTDLNLGTGINPYWIIKLPSEMFTNRLIELLGQKQIGHRRWWSFGCHKMPAFQHLSAEEFHQTDYVVSISLGLPFFRDMKQHQFDAINHCLIELFS